jgi:CheY-like chemotaxis protein
MTLNLCPLCQHPNAADARACRSCGVGLVLFCPQCGTVNDVGPERCFHCAALLRGDATDVATPPATKAAPAPAAPTVQPAQAMPVDRAERKAAIRAAVRRAQLSNAAPLPVAATMAADVLVLDSDELARDELCALLAKFGFNPYPADRVAQASMLVDKRLFAAAFLEVAFDGSDHGVGVELCQRVKQSTSRLTGRSPAVFVLAARPRPVDRVRASLAGCDAFVTKPPTRGTVARALEACGLPLPADPRRHDRDSRSPADRQDHHPVGSSDPRR